MQFKEDQLKISGSLAAPVARSLDYWRASVGLLSAHPM